MQADAYATALTVLDGERAVESANARGLAMRILERTADGFIERSSLAFDAMLDEAP
jgi:thiamine biosynthesis lipoprotein ApbE